MLRVVVLVVLAAIVVITLLRSANRLLQSPLMRALAALLAAQSPASTSRSGQQGRAAQRAPEELVRCSQCGTHVPQREIVAKGAKDSASAVQLCRRCSSSGAS